MAWPSVSHYREGMSVIGPGLPLRRFTARELHRMKEAGALAPRARVDLADGVLVDRPRRGVRQSADVETHAGFDATLMVHDWPTHPLTAPWRLHRFSVPEYQRLMDVGILKATERSELIDGVVCEVAPRRPYVQRRVERLAGLLREQAPDDVVRAGEPVRLGPYSLVRPGLTVCRGRADGYRTRPPIGEDVLLVVDLATDPSDARWRVGWPVYARGGIPLAWLADLAREEVRIAREPTTTGYARIDAYRRDEVLAPPLAFSVLAVADILG